jgi:hypothetical protein
MKDVCGESRCKTRTISLPETMITAWDLGIFTATGFKVVKFDHFILTN